MDDQAFVWGPFRILFFKEGQTFLAQCIDWDICTQGNSLEQCKERFWRGIQGEIHFSMSDGIEPFSKRTYLDPKYTARYNLVSKKS